MLNKLFYLLFKKKRIFLVLNSFKTAQFLGIIDYSINFYIIVKNNLEYNKIYFSIYFFKNKKKILIFY